jgi:hypothetical protein
MAQDMRGATEKHKGLSDPLAQSRRGDPANMKRHL